METIRRILQFLRVRTWSLSTVALLEFGEPGDFDTYVTMTADLTSTESLADTKWSPYSPKDSRAIRTDDTTLRIGLVVV